MKQKIHLTHFPKLILKVAVIISPLLQVHGQKSGLKNHAKTYGTINVSDLKDSVYYQGGNEQSENQEKENRNIQNYTPSVLLKQGQFELKNFNSIYTESKGFNNEGQKINRNFRSTFFTSITQFLFGVAPGFNAGADVWIRSVSYGQPSSSPLKVLEFNNDFSSRTALTYIGPKVKFRPLKKVVNLAVQSSFLFPMEDKLEGKGIPKPYIDEDRYLWITKVNYDQPLGRNFQLFLQLSPWVSLNRYGNKMNNSLATPLSAFLSYFATPRFTFYLQSEIWPTYGYDQIISAYFWQEGLGIKYQPIIGKLEAEILYTRFLTGKNTGAGQTYNLGLRWLY